MNLRTLQANNRSLAASLEKLRQNFRQVHHHNTLLLENNQSLRVKILELQRVDASDKYIENEVNRRFEKRLEFVTKKLGSLSDLAKGFYDTFSELSDVCLLKKSLEIEDPTSTESSYNNYSLIPNLQIISTEESLDTASEVESAQSDCRLEDEFEDADLDNNRDCRKDLVHEMSSIMEQSMMSPSNGCPIIDSKLDPVPEISLSTAVKNITKLPMRILRVPKDVNKQNNEQARKSIERLDEIKRADAAKKVCRRETFILMTSGPPDEGFLTDIAMPQFLVSNSNAEDVHVDVQESVSTPSSPAKKRMSLEKYVNKRVTSKVNQISPKLPKPVTSHGGEKSPKRLSVEKYVSKQNTAKVNQISPKPPKPVTTHGGEKSPNKPSPHQLPSPMRMKQTRKQSLPRGTRSRSKSGQISPNKIISPAANQHVEKQLSTTHRPVAQKPATPTKKRKTPGSPTLKKKSPKHFFKLGDKNPKQNLFIANEFNLLNAHKQRLESSNSKSSYAAINFHCLPTAEAGEHTIFPGDDMELTRTEESLKSPSKLCNSNDRIGMELDSNLPSSRSRDKPKQTVQAINEEECFADEKVPDAVTMRLKKPGHFVFAAARKESDGTRKNVPPVVPKARSKSKKEIASMIENLPNTKPQSIFDFHDKTPRSMASEKHDANSVFNFSADTSRLSPAVPLNQNVSRKKSNRCANEPSSKSALLSEVCETNKKFHSLLSDGFTFEVPLKDDSPAAKSTYGTRSRSRSRKFHDTASGEVKPRTRSQSSKRWPHSRADSEDVGAKTPSPFVTNSEIICSKQTSDTVDEHTGCGNCTEQTSGNSKSGQPAATDHLDSNAACKQTELNFELLDKEIQVKSGEKFQEKLSSPKDPSKKVRSRKHMSEKKRKKNNVLQSENIDIHLSPTTVENNGIKTGDNTACIKCIELVETEPDSLEGIHEMFKQVDEIDSQALSVTSSSKSQDTSNIVSERIMNEIDSSRQSACSEGTTRQDSKSPQTLNTETLSSAPLKKKKNRNGSSSRKTNALAQNMAHTTKDDQSLEFGNVISTRTKEKKGDKGLQESDINSVDEHLDADFATDRDSAVRTKFTQIKTAWDDAATETSNQLLEKLKGLRTPALTYSDDKVKSAATTPSSDKDEIPQRNGQDPRVSKIVRVLNSNNVLSGTKRPASQSSPENLAVVDGKRRRAATRVNYAEMNLNVKLRRGDPFTSHYCTGDKVDIYKSPKGKAKKKVVHRNILGNLHNQSIQEEQGLLAE